MQEVVEQLTITETIKRPSTFISTVDAALIVGVSDKVFLRAVEAMGMEPVVFKGPFIEKHMWLRTDIESRADEIRAKTGQSGKSKNQKARLPVGDLDASELQDATE